MKWQNVSKEVAGAYTYYGLRGWLLLLYVVAIVFFVLNGISAGLLLWGHEGAWAPIEILGLLHGVAFMITALPFIILAPRYHPKLPYIAIGMYAINFVVQMGVSFYLTNGQWIGWENALVPVLLVIVLIWYFVSSKRVNATYHHRVPADYAQWAETGIPYKGFIIPHNDEKYVFRGVEFTDIGALYDHIDKIVK